MVGIIRIMRRDCVAAAMTEDFTGLIRILIALTLITINVGEHAQARARREHFFLAHPSASPHLVHLPNE